VKSRDVEKLRAKLASLKRKQALVQMSEDEKSQYVLNEMQTHVVAMEAEILQMDPERDSKRIIKKTKQKNKLLSKIRKLESKVFLRSMSPVERAIHIRDEFQRAGDHANVRRQELQVALVEAIATAGLEHNGKITVVTEEGKQVLKGLQLRHAAQLAELEVELYIEEQRQNHVAEEKYQNTVGEGCKEKNADSDDISQVEENEWAATDVDLYRANDDDSDEKNTEGETSDVENAQPEEETVVRANIDSPLDSLEEANGLTLISSE